MWFQRVAWGLVLSLFFVSLGVSFWPIDKHVFVSPDENAAFVFAEQFAKTGTLIMPEPINEAVGGLLHPRSTLGFGNAVLPASFTGFIFLTGIIGAIFGASAMVLVTPVLAVLAVILWRDLIRRVFQQTALANLSAIFLLIHPAFWYYSGRTMMHNVAFLTLLIAGLWWLVAQPLTYWVKKSTRSSVRLLDFFIAGCLIGAALMLRTSEILWVTASLGLGVVAYRYILGWRAITMLVGGGVLMLAVLASLNQFVYGSPWVTGYTARYPFASIVTSPTPDNAVSLPTLQSGGLLSVLLPFGFHEYNIAYNVINYGWKLYPWMSVLAVIGMLLAIVKRDSQRSLWRGLALVTLGLAVWLGMVYGSWRIIDNPDPSIISLGNSHVRYWLPLFALASVFCARTLVYLLDDYRWWRQVLAYGIVGLAGLMSLHLVLFGHDGFIYNREALHSFVLKRDMILANTESTATVIVDRADKYVYPHRRVVVPLRQETTYASIPVLLRYVPVYYFGITLPDSDLEYLNTTKLAPLNVQIEWVQTLADESLYRFTAR
jgi:hypothetical protein